jgi:hypothetical protein
MLAEGSLYDRPPRWAVQGRMDFWTMCQRTVLWGGDYWEAVGVVAALRAGIDAAAIRRPIVDTVVTKERLAASHVGRSVNGQCANRTYPAVAGCWAQYQAADRRECTNFDSRFPLSPQTRDRPPKAFATRIAARVASACSQNLSTVHPAARSWKSVSLSRSRFASIFARHQLALAFGHVPCSGQPCQKHPSTNTATLARTNATSARRRVPGKVTSMR